MKWANTVYEVWKEPTHKYLVEVGIDKESNLINTLYIKDQKISYYEFPQVDTRSDLMCYGWIKIKDGTLNER